ncbi:B3 domain-containing transcription factor VRN1 [Prunus yedoensis var. nudiflora]|uniref:B3 domain-containing transcription factor VRN1 n=1 Tax=Prunus yedoensis var. nudiflora TaxID=2094558 RepID=A0A314V0J4_PRUYE|nr:B3 domain-containing transcription factor VRN1 [Prunus yedoensis var. nudiflora]
MMFENSLRNKASDCSKSEMKREDESDDDCVETLDKFPPPPKIRGQISISTTRCQRWCWEDASNNYPSGKAITLQRAIAFESASPSFTIVMHPSYLHKGLLTASRVW